MRNISFALTTPQFKAGTKTVTRRRGWESLEIGQSLCVVEKGQGLKKGQTVTKLGTIRVLAVSRERLKRMIDDPLYGRAECIREGFPEMKPAEFVAMYRNANHCEADAEVTRIEFEKLP